MNLSWVPTVRCATSHIVVRISSCWTRQNGGNEVESGSALFHYMNASYIMNISYIERSDLVEVNPAIYRDSLSYERNEDSNVLYCLESNHTSREMSFR